MTGSSEESTSWVAAAVNGASALASSAITYLKGDPRTELMMKGSEASSDTVVNSDEAIETGPAAAAPPAPADSNAREGGSPVIAPEARSVPLLDTDDNARQLEAPFVEAFGTAPTFYVRAPGRVNLIGEHVDYSGYGVLPMALELAVRMAVAVAEDGNESTGVIKLANTDARFPTREVSADPQAAVGGASGHDWSGYFQCGYKGVFDHARTEQLLSDEVLAKGLPGLRVLVVGDVPPGGGLSSSSAMVVASALVTAHALGLQLTRGALASLSARAEQYIGVMSGGMDQTASSVSEAGNALHIEFEPELSVKLVDLPAGTAFVVCNSLAKAEKAVSALLHYNKRVVECRLASALLAQAAGVPKWRDVRTLLEVQRAGSQTLQEMVQFAKQHLPAEGTTKDALRNLLGCDPAELFSDMPKGVEVLGASDDFWLRDRAMHVYSEAERVLSFDAVCSDRDGGASPGREGIAARELGELMDASHASCRDLYDCSCKELEALVAAAKKAGAYGSRLTGAGWGGCTVSIMNVEQVDAFIQFVKDEYYGDRYTDGVVFATAPARGAAVYA